MSIQSLIEALSAGNARTKNRRNYTSDLSTMLLQAKSDAQPTNVRRGPQGNRGPGGRDAPIVGSGQGGMPGSFKNMVSPVKGINVTSNYGPRIHPIHGGHSNHTGVDFSGSRGDPIRAVSSGRVKKAKWDDVYGNQIVIGHGKRRATMYGHLNKSLVKPGQRVRRGQIIGYMGSTGWSTGDHLHFETWLRGNPVNPMRFLGN